MTSHHFFLRYDIQYPNKSNQQTDMIYTSTTQQDENDTKVDYKDDDQISLAASASSVDTNEAFMDMLGLSMYEKNEHLLNIDMEEDDDEDDEGYKNHNGDSTTSTNENKEYSFEIIHLPPRCSRHLIAPKSCLAIVIDNVLTKEQCQYLIQKASGSASGSASSSSNNGHQKGQGFRYITEATHKALDGTSYTVQIQNPNPHKLAVIDTFHNPSNTDIDINHTNNKNKNDTRKRRKQIYHGHEDPQATIIMDHIYQTISQVLQNDDNNNSSSISNHNPMYQKFVQRTNCGDHQGLNPRMRILKYDADCNDRFEPHFDATTFVSHQYYDDDDHEEESTMISSIEKTSTESDHVYTHTNDRLQSLITVLVYLNNGDGEDFDGGETFYLDYHNSSHGTATAINTNVNTNTTTTTTHTTTSISDHSNNHVKVIPKVGRVVLFEHDLYHSGSSLTFGTKYVMRTDVLYNEVQQNNNQGGKIDDSTSDPSLNKSSRSSGSSTTTTPTTGTTTPSNMNDEKDDIQLLIHICDEMNISSKDKEILNGMDLLHSSLEAFISPGITLLKHMLLDAGMEEGIVNNLIQRSVALVKR